MASEGRAVAKDDDLHASPGDSDVHTTQVAEKANLSLVVRAYKGDEYDVTLLTLKAIDSVDADQVAVGLEELAFLEEPSQVLHLGAIGGDDTYVKAFVKDTLLADLLEIILKG